MKVKDIIESCAIMLQKDDVLRYLEAKNNNENLEEFGSEVLNDVSTLIRCTNLVLNEIALEYVPLKETENVFSADGNISFDDLSKNAVEILAVSDLNGDKVRFSLTYDKIIAESGNLQITYYYVPENKELESSIEFKIPSRIIAYGVAAEYCLIDGLYEEAIMWDKRYKDSMMNFIRRKREIVLKERRWI